MKINRFKSTISSLAFAAVFSLGAASANDPATPREVLDFYEEQLADAEKNGQTARSDGLRNLIAEIEPLLQEYAELNDRHQRLEDARAAYNEQLAAALENGDEKRAAEIRALLAEITTLQNAIHDQSTQIAENLNSLDDERMDDVADTRSQIMRHFSLLKWQLIGDQLEIEGDFEDTRAAIAEYTQYISCGEEVREKSARELRMAALEIVSAEAGVEAANHMLENGDLADAEREIVEEQRDLSQARLNAAQQWLTTLHQIIGVAYVVDIASIVAGGPVARKIEEGIIKCAARGFGKKAGQRTARVVQYDIIDGVLRRVLPNPSQTVRTGANAIDNAIANGANDAGSAGGRAVASVTDSSGETVATVVVKQDDTLAMNSLDVFGETAAHSLIDVTSAASTKASRHFEAEFARFLRIHGIDLCNASQATMNAARDAFLKKHGFRLLGEVADDVAGSAMETIGKFGKMSKGEIDGLVDYMTAKARDFSNVSRNLGPNGQQRVLDDMWRRFFTGLARHSQTDRRANLVAEAIAEKLGGDRAVRYLNDLIPHVGVDAAGDPVLKGAARHLTPPRMGVGPLPKPDPVAPVSGWNTFPSGAAPTPATGAPGTVKLNDTGLFNAAPDDPFGTTTLFGFGAGAPGLGLCGNALGADPETADRNLLDSLQAARNSIPSSGGDALVNQDPYGTYPGSPYLTQGGDYQLVKQAQRDRAHAEAAVHDYHLNHQYTVKSDGNARDQGADYPTSTPFAPAYGERTCGGSAPGLGLRYRDVDCAARAPKPDTAYESGPRIAVSGPAPDDQRTCGGSAFDGAGRNDTKSNGLCGYADQVAKNDPSLRGVVSRTPSPNLAANGQIPYHGYKIGANGEYDIRLDDIVLDGADRPDDNRTRGPKRNRGGTMTPVTLSREQIDKLYKDRAAASAHPIETKGVRTGKIVIPGYPSAEEPDDGFNPVYRPRLSTGGMTQIAAPTFDADVLGAANRRGKDETTAAIDPGTEYNRPVFAPGIPTSLNRMPIPAPIVQQNKPVYLDGSGPVDPADAGVAAPTAASSYFDTGGQKGDDAGK